MSVLIIAEAGVNHNGEKDKAFALVDAAAAAGADAVKFQTYKTEDLASMSVPKADYQKRSTDSNETQFEMLKKLELPESWHFELKLYAENKGITFISTAFDIKSLSFLEKLGLPFYKVPSGEITNAPLLKAFARTGKEIILSTGMATLGEVEQALAILAWGFLCDKEPESLDQIWQHWSVQDTRKSIREKVSLLHCTSQYPTPLSEVNLKAMDTLSSAFGLPVGYSDHTEGLLIPLAAVSRGATIIEKHFTLDRQLPGPDHRASLEPDELKEMVTQIRSLEQALGDGYKAPQPSEFDSRTSARQSLVAKQDMAKGSLFTFESLGTARTGNGISALHYWDNINTPATKNYKAGEAL